MCCAHCRGSGDMSVTIRCDSLVIPHQQTSLVTAKYCILKNSTSTSNIFWGWSLTPVFPAPVSGAYINQHPLNSQIMGTFINLEVDTHLSSIQCFLLEKKEALLYRLYCMNQNSNSVMVAELVPTLRFYCMHHIALYSAK